MSTSTLPRHLLSAMIFGPFLLLSGTALAAPRLLEHEESLSALNNFDLSTVSLASAIAHVEAKTGGKVITHELGVALVKLPRPKRRQRPIDS